MSPFQTSPPASLTFWCLGGISQKQNSINRKTASVAQYEDPSVLLLDLEIQTG